MGQLEAPAGVWTVPIQTIDRPPSMLDPHIEIGLYRPNPTSTIDFDYIKIETKKESALEAKFGKYSDADICAAVKKFGEFKQGRDWVNESQRRKLSCNDSTPPAQATTDPYQSYSDKQICTMVGALNGLAEQKLWIKEAKRRGLSQCK